MIRLSVVSSFNMDESRNSCVLLSCSSLSSSVPPSVLAIASICLDSFSKLLHSVRQRNVQARAANTTMLTCKFSLNKPEFANTQTPCVPGLPHVPDRRHTNDATFHNTVTLSLGRCSTPNLGVKGAGTNQVCITNWVQVEQIEVNHEPGNRAIAQSDDIYPGL